MFDHVKCRTNVFIPKEIFLHIVSFFANIYFQFIKEYGLFLYTVLILSAMSLKQTCCKLI